MADPKELSEQDTEQVVGGVSYAAPISGDELSKRLNELGIGSQPMPSIGAVRPDLSSPVDVAPFPAPEPEADD